MRQVPNLKVVPITVCSRIILTLRSQFLVILASEPGPEFPIAERFPLRSDLSRIAPLEAASDLYEHFLSFNKRL